MTNLKPIKFVEITNEGQYLIVIEEYERYGGNDNRIHKIGFGEDVIKLLKETWDYEDWELENEDKHIGDFLNFIEEANGDGDDYFEIFSL